MSFKVVLLLNKFVHCSFCIVCVSYYYDAESHSDGTVLFLLLDFMHTPVWDTVSVFC